ncbi:TRAP transporter, DctQ-like membrane protein [Sulfitobacter noctilucicola]|uniref:TRAP transporter small permease protein n=1 Tax=Sulfitobacter noctilucicola TaxID=1342301 RepID=A0A7W6MA19_9RHOB|nr:TRAP transporter small permease [Sulfitobacter noctilucicola]KIN63468.1 TRAP transporter, DctQ-like membrane protein [Sulfitobacter noctilucicola]MBB4175021.1 TRAP-type C4-dicarboxylate transport system permease small subunit [Sulfitobacter noctilucicola]
MTAVFKTYSALVYAMAIVAGATLLWLMISVIGSVMMRNLGMQPAAWLFTSAEYGILYMTMLGAPWLVREKGHVHIELVTAALPEQARRLVSRLVAVACVLVCVILAWKGVELFLKNIARGDFDTRAYYYPRWLLTITFPLSFGIMAIEFSRFVFGDDLMHSGEAGIHE